MIVSGLTSVFIVLHSQLPIDLRKPIASSILITGGTAMLPGFFPRLQHALKQSLSLSHPPSPPPSPPPPSTLPLSADDMRAQRHKTLSQRLTTLRTTPHFSPLVPLASHLAIINDPTPMGTSVLSAGNQGKAPGFAPSLMGWIGGSLAGALKTGGEEIKRESWDLVIESYRREADERDGGGMDVEPRGMLLPDWTRIKVAA